MGQQEVTKIKEKPITIELAKFIIYVITLTITAIIFFGTFDRRITVVETELQHKINEKQLFERIELMEEKLSKKIEQEIKKIKK
jgi:hypothetical protein